MKHELHCDAPEQCHQRSAEKYNNNNIYTTVKHGLCGEPF